MPVDVFVDVVSVVAFQAAMLEMNQENEGIKPAVSFCVHSSHLLTIHHKWWQDSKLEVFLMEN